MAAAPKNTATRNTAAKKTTPPKVPAQSAVKASTGSTRTPASLRTKRVVPEIYTEIVNVTPELALEWLDGNTLNRPINDATIAQYARDMVAGRWLLNGETIQRCRDGRLLNGQHRLLAVIKSGKTVQMLVVFNLPSETQLTMDGGRKRGHKDNLSLLGEKNSKILASVARRAVLWERGDRVFHGLTSFGEIREMLEKHPELHRSAEIGVRVNSSFRALSATVLGTAHYLLHQTGPEDTPWFFGAIEKGARLEEGDPVLTLRERVRSDKDAGIRLSDVRAVGYIVCAWNSHRRGKTLARIQHPNGAPIPKIL